MVNKPLFSILIANYNNGRYLQEAIDSCFCQTYDNWEIIIVDDGSTDNSNEIYESLVDKDDKVHIYYNGVNRGCAYTKHQCVLKAQGELCGFLDPDDVLLPKALEVSVKALLKSKKNVLTFSRHYVCDEQLNIVSESRLLKLDKYESYFTHHQYQAEVFAGFRKCAYFATGGLDIANKRGVDADLYFRLEEQGEIVIIDEFTYKYRMHSDSLVADVDKMMYWNLMIRHNTCIRRGLPVTEYSMKDFTDYIQSVVELRSAQNERALNSKAYRLGKLLLAPFKIFKK